MAGLRGRVRSDLSPYLYFRREVAELAVKGFRELIVTRANAVCLYPDGHPTLGMHRSAVLAAFQLFSRRGQGGA